VEAFGRPGYSSTVQFASVYRQDVPELERLSVDHAEAVLDFELTNRAYFAASISDRDDEFFEHFAEQYRALLAEQQAGGAAFHVLVAGDGSVLGRFNLLFDDDASAKLVCPGRRTGAGERLRASSRRFVDGDRPSSAAIPTWLIPDSRRSASRNRSSKLRYRPEVRRDSSPGKP